MVSKKGKRRFIYNDSVYYWYIKITNNEHKVHIISDDKKLHLEYPFLDTEVSVTPQVVKNHLEEYFANL